MRLPQNAGTRSTDKPDCEILLVGVWGVKYE